MTIYPIIVLPRVICCGSKLKGPYFRLNHGLMGRRNSVDRTALLRLGNARPSEKVCGAVLQVRSRVFALRQRADRQKTAARPGEKRAGDMGVYAGPRRAGRPVQPIPSPNADGVDAIGPLSRTVEPGAPPVGGGERSRFGNDHGNVATGATDRPAPKQATASFARGDGCVLPKPPAGGGVFGQPKSKPGRQARSSKARQHHPGQVPATGASGAGPIPRNLAARIYVGRAFSSGAYVTGSLASRTHRRNAAPDGGGGEPFPYDPSGPSRQISSSVTSTKTLFDQGEGPRHLVDPRRFWAGTSSDHADRVVSEQSTAKVRIKRSENFGRDGGTVLKSGSPRGNTDN